MITALYGWAKFKAREEGLLSNITPQQFNDSLKNILRNNYTTIDLETVYLPIKDLFEIDPEQNKKYRIYIVSNKGETPISQQEMKYIMVPKKNLTGKAQQSIGVSIFARTTLKEACKETKSTYTKTQEHKTKTYCCKIPKDKLQEFWRVRLINTYFLSEEKQTYISLEKQICAFCGCEHHFKNLRFNPPVNIFVENITNYNSYLSNEPSHSICPYCNMLFLRTVNPEKGPQTIYFPRSRRAFIYVLPYSPDNDIIYEIFSKEKVEEMLKAEFNKLGWKVTQLDALNYILSLPLLIYRCLPTSLGGHLKPYVYLIFGNRSKQAEEINNYFVVRRFDYLFCVGEKLYQLNSLREIHNFQQRLLRFVDKFNPDQKVSAYRLIFRFLDKMITEGEIDFSFLHHLLRQEIMNMKREERKYRLYGYRYLEAFLKAKKEVFHG